MQTKITQIDILHRIPKLRKNTSWKKLPNGEYYINSTDFNSSLFVSEYVIEFLRLATGENTIVQICEKAGLYVNESNISKIYELYYTILYPTGVLETEEIEIKKKKSYINLSFTILPEKIVIFISKYLSFLFKKKVVVISLLFSLFLIFLGSINFWQTKFSLNIANNGEPIIVAILLTLTFFLHEFGHSSALYYFGENPRKIGIGLYLFAPVMFADVTDSWKLNNKQRMVVDIGGLYFQLIASCIYLFIFLIFGRNVFLITALFSFVIGILNLNPFVKMDGYWLLSDFLNIMDLKQRSRKKTLLCTQSLFKRELSCRMQDIFFVSYYLMSFVFRFAFIAYMLFWNIELFTNIHVNIKTIALTILERNYYNINIVLIESVILPFIVIFLVSNVLIKVLYKGIVDFNKTLQH